jgi:phosphinothricin acetyltransferase
VAFNEFLSLFSKENGLYGTDSDAYLVGLSFVLFAILYYISYYVISIYFRKKTIIRNPEIEQMAFDIGVITDDQLMVKYSSNLSASSTMAALSVTMVLLSVAALFQKELAPYDNFIAILVCTLMTIASAALLFAHELYDAIINPVFEPKKRFKLRKLGSDFQALGLLLFIVSMLLAISTVSIMATIFSSFVCCVVMTIYIEKRLVPQDSKDLEIQRMIKLKKGNDMKVRKAETRDFLAIAALDREAWKQNRNSEFIPDGEHAWRLWVEHALVFCTEINGEIVGTILAFPSVKDTYCVHKVFVSYEHRDQGIGSKLFSVLLQEIDRKKTDAFLTVDPSNNTAIALYNKWGFTDQIYVKGYYRDDEDRLVLTRHANA